MADYLSTLTPEQKTNIGIITDRMVAKGITNPFTQAAILSVASKESEFKLHRESGYGKTPNDRIRAIFGKKVKDLSEAQLTALKANDVAFFNKIYGGVYGNGPADGYKYRGGGFNQLTFKDNFAAEGKKIGVDLVNNPDLINTPSVAADALIQYFIDRFKAAPAGTLAKYNSTGLNDFKNESDSLRAVYQANAGWGFKDADINDKTGGFDKAKARIAGFLIKAKDTVVTTVTQNPGKSAATGVALFFLGVAFVLTRPKKKPNETPTNI